MKNLNAFDILGYGVIGLGFLLAFLAYRLLSDEQKRKGQPRQKILASIYIFMAFSISLCIIGFFSEINRQRVSAEEKNCAEEAKALHRLVADRLESRMIGFTPSSKGIAYDDTNAIQEFYYKLLKRATFLCVLDYGANEKILNDALISLRNRGYDILDSHIRRLNSELPDILKLRLRWLEDQAIPLLNKNIVKLRRSPVQQSPQAEVSLPSEVWLVEHEDEEEPTETVRDMNKLRDEVQLLKEIL